METAGVQGADGILMMDLGLLHGSDGSAPRRAYSYDAPLDMRMNRR